MAEPRHAVTLMKLNHTATGIGLNLFLSLLTHWMSWQKNKCCWVGFCWFITQFLQNSWCWHTRLFESALPAGIGCWKETARQAFQDVDDDDDDVDDDDGDDDECVSRSICLANMISEIELMGVVLVVHYAESPQWRQHLQNSLCVRQPDHPHWPAWLCLASKSWSWAEETAEQLTILLSDGVKLPTRPTALLLSDNSFNSIQNEKQHAIGAHTFAQPWHH